MSNFAQLDAYLAKNQDAHLEMLFELLRIPSVSADSTKKSDMDRAASWVADKFRTAGLKTELIPGDGPALVYAETDPVPGQPVVLVYGHYDVQPADPLELWKTPPFEPSVRDGNIYARGSTDDKGQMLTHVLSILSWKACGMKLPLQVKFLIEGKRSKGAKCSKPSCPRLPRSLLAM